MADFFLSFASSFLSIFSEPEKRLFFGYLLSACLIGWFWIWRVSGVPAAQALRSLFSAQIWWSASARGDYAMVLLNRMILPILGSRLISQLAIATLVFEAMHHGWKPEGGLAWPGWLIVTAFTSAVFICDDASRYLLHRWLHQVRFLWCFHRVHHSAEVLNPLTILRTHPVEALLFTLRSSLVQGACIGAFVFVFGDRVDLVTVLGANLFIFAFNTLGANLRHSHIPVHYPRRVEAWLISPAQHQLHHSRHSDHRDCNFGVVLALWDRLGSTWRASEPERQLQYGCADQGGVEEHRLSTLYLRPFGQLFEMLLIKRKVP